MHEYHPEMPASGHRCRGGVGTRVHSGSTISIVARQTVITAPGAAAPGQHEEEQ